jgi:hypothetical protein
MGEVVTMQRGSPGLRRLGWAVGAAAALGVLAVGAVIWLFGWAWPHSGNRAQRDADNQLQEVAATIARQLGDRSADGQLTRAEIVDVVGHQPAGLVSIQFDGSPLSVVALVHGVASGPAGSVGASRCYRFTIPAPVGAGGHVEAIPLASCPAAAPTR